MDNLVEVDIETKKIVKGAPLLPEPVGVALGGLPGRDRLYLAWGHPSENNCTKEQARNVIKSIWDQRWLTHNGCIFDVPGLAHTFGLPARDPLLTEDTLFAAYLADPNAQTISLKPLAAEKCGIAPDEQDDLYDWIMANVPDCRSRKECGGYISEAPAGIVGRYAIGDILRTRAIWEFYQPVVEDMREAYDRERKLAPILAGMQNRGVRVDVPALEQAHHITQLKRARVEAEIRAHLGVGPSFNPGSDKELGERLVEMGYDGFILTPTGRPSMARKSLDQALETDPKLKSMLNSKSVFDTLLNNFMTTWLQICYANNGRMHPSWNQTVNEQGYGTRTGRLSADHPSFQNVSKEFDGVDWEGDPFPLLRAFLLPEVGQIWACGDFKSQEPRLTAHYEGGVLMQAYIENPELDPYRFLMELVGGTITRHHAKQVFLGLVYAMGLDALARKLKCTPDEALFYRNMVKAQLRDVVELDRDCKDRFRRGLPIRTLGGRIYYCEPPSNGRVWDYKALNTLIQGSAADQTKEAMIYLEPRITSIGGFQLGSVHDEINASIFDKDINIYTEYLQEAANALHCDVPMIMDVGFGANWMEAKK